MTADIEQELRASLRREVERVEVPPVPGLEASPAPARWWRRPGGFAIAAVAAAAVVVTALAVPALLRGNETPLPPTQSYDSALSPEHWPVRGPLAGDTELLARARVWFASNVTSTAKHKPSDFHIVYAGDVGEHRIIVASFVRTYGGPERLRYREFIKLHAPAGSSSLDGAIGEGDGPRLASGTDLRSYHSIAVVELRTARTVLVIAPPGTDRLDYSPAAQLHANGTITRSWRPLRDARVGDGIFQFAKPLTDARPRIRAVLDGRVAADTRLSTYAFVSDKEVSRLRGLIRTTSGGKAVGRLASSLADFEQTIGRVIERVDVLRTFGPEDDYWVMAVVRTFDGAAIEVFYSDHPDLLDGPVRQDGYVVQPPPLVTRLVPASQAGEGLAVWLDLNHCQVLGWDPTNRTVSAELIKDGKARPRVQTGSEPIRARFCEVQTSLDEEAEYVVRLYDGSGKQVWSGEPAYNPHAGALNYHENLDVPSTIGARVG